MISAQQSNSPSPHVLRRAKRMHVRTLSPFTYLVIPEPGKAVRVVTLDRSDTGVIKIECVDRETGEVCPANSFSKHCAHVEAALRRLLINAKKQEKIQAEEDKRNKAISKYARTILRATKQPNIKGIQQ
jgi:hypothetical protein